MIYSKVYGATELIPISIPGPATRVSSENHHQYLSIRQVIKYWSAS